MAVGEYPFPSMPPLAGIKLATASAGIKKPGRQDVVLIELAEGTRSAGVEDELYHEAVQFVIERQTASVSMLQRKFRIGYTRAARLIDEMEARNIVGPYEGSRPRKVLVSNHEEVSSS